MGATKMKMVMVVYGGHKGQDGNDSQDGHCGHHGHHHHHQDQDEIKKQESCNSISSSGNVKDTYAP